METLPSICCTLKSGNDRIKLNTSTNFITELPNELKLPKDVYEVGVTTLHYTPSEPKIEAKEEKKKAVIPKGPLFPNLKPPTEVTSTLKKSNKQLTLFLSDVNIQLENEKMPVVFSFYPLEDSVIVTIVMNSPVTRQYLVIPDDLATLLGFNRNRFPYGKIPAVTPVTNASFENVPMGTEYIIKLVTYKDTQNLIGIHMPFETILPFQRQNSQGDEDPNVYLKRLCEKMMLYYQNFSMKIGPDKKTTFTFEDVISTKSFCVVPQKLLDCIGFIHDTFTAGTHKSDFEFNLDKYKEIADISELDFRFQTYADFPIEMNEPINLEIDNVLTEINGSFESNLFGNTEVQFVIANGDIYIQSVITEKMSVKLPKAVNKYLGIDENQEFFCNTKVKVGSDIQEQEEEKEIEEEEIEDKVPADAKPTKLLILSDIVQNQLYGHHVLPILQDVDLSKDYKNETRIDFNPVIYLPLSRQHLRQIHINLVDEF
jgi:hypothetical protein